MNPELQTLVDRIEALEGQGRGLRVTTFLAFLVAAAAVAAAVLAVPKSRTLTPPSTGRFDTVEANRIVLRDLDSRAAGGLEVDRNGTIRLVLGRAGETGAALLEAQRNGISHLTLRNPDGDVVVALVGSRLPELALGKGGVGVGVRASVSESGSGSITALDANGRVRFRAP